MSDTLLLVSGATDTVRRYSHDPNLGRLLTPDTGNSIQELADCGLPFGVDNAFFNNPRPSAYLKMLDKVAVQDRTRMLWVSVPDVVGNHAATVEFFRVWAPELVGRGLPVAFVAQDGATISNIPWGEIDCLFIGGTTRWKMSRIPVRLSLWARHLEILCHWGRVNTDNRMDWIGALLEAGADSFDGSSHSMFPDTYIPRTLARLKNPIQLGMKGVMLYAR